VSAATVTCMTLTIEETAIALGIGRTAAYAAAASGEIPARRIGRRYVVPKAALEAFLGATSDDTEEVAS
jgi:excisionase family DNA binding protein